MVEPATNSPMPGGKPRQDRTVAEIEKLARQRANRRKSASMYKQQRAIEIRDNEKKGRPGDVDFQRMIKNFRKKEMEGPSAHASTGPLKINVVVRKRPVSDTEIRKKDYDAVSCSNPRVYVHHSKLKVDGITKYLDNVNFELDHVFHESASNDEVYDNTARYLVEFAVGGGRATCFAYGQTGSGKTYTMAGLQANAARDVFRLASGAETAGLEVHCGFFELYGGRCIDLLHERKVCSIREDGRGRVHVEGLQELLVCDEEELLQLIERGNSSRTTHATEMNDDSSRSHAICQISLRQISARPGAEPYGKLSLIDLAGSERGQDTKHHNSQRRQESAEINKSLLALKECVRALDSASSHVPYRASKLTMILKDSFSQDSRMVMISCISPVASSSDHSLNTLRYADRVKEKHVKAAPGGNKRLSICNAPLRKSGVCDSDESEDDDDNDEDDDEDEDDDGGGGGSGGSGRKSRGGTARAPSRGLELDNGTIDEGDESESDEHPDEDADGGEELLNGHRGCKAVANRSGAARNHSGSGSGSGGGSGSGARGARPKSAGSPLPRSTPVKSKAARQAKAAKAGKAGRAAAATGSPAPAPAPAPSSSKKGRHQSKLLEPARRSANPRTAANALARGAERAAGNGAGASAGTAGKGEGQVGVARRKEWGDPATAREPLHPQHNANVILPKSSGPSHGQSQQKRRDRTSSGKGQHRRGAGISDDEEHDDSDDDDGDEDDRTTNGRVFAEGEAKAGLYSRSRSRNQDGAGSYVVADKEEEVVDFNVMVAQLVDKEEELLSEHMHTIQRNADLLTEEGVLLSKVQGSDVVDYDIDEYASRLDDIIVAKLDLFSNLHGKLKKFRSLLALENKAVAAAAP